MPRVQLEKQSIENVRCFSCKHFMRDSASTYGLATVGDAPTDDLVIFKCQYCRFPDACIHFKPEGWKILYKQGDDTANWNNNDNWTDKDCLSFMQAGDTYRKTTLREITNVLRGDHA